MKEQMKEWLQDWDMAYVDVGASTLDPEDDYPDFALAVAQHVARDVAHHRGILACRSAAGVVIAANKVNGVRAVAPASLTAAHHSREHNDANVIGLSGDWLLLDEAKDMLHAWLTTPFSGEARHQRRLDKITAFEQQ